jgi:hypothetical protein
MAVPSHHTNDQRFWQGVIWVKSLEWVKSLKSKVTYSPSIQPKVETEKTDEKSRIRMFSTFMRHEIESGWCLRRSAGCMEAILGLLRSNLLPQEHSLGELIFGEGEIRVHANLMCLSFTAQCAWICQIPF